MRKSKLVGLAIATLIVIGVSGCGPKNEPVSDTSTTSASGPDVKTGVKSNVMTDVPSTGSQIPAGGMTLQPKNPNDPRYKPGPGISGAG
jgi:hypothetical protein